MKRYILIIPTFTIMVLFIPSSFLMAASGLKIGVAKVKITPEEPTILAGYYGENNLCNPLTDILDDIYCRILVAEDGSGKREVFLSMDVCAYMENDYYDQHNGGRLWPKTVPSGTTQRFANAGSVGLDNVFVSATHTHQASEQLAEKYIQRIIDGINTAKNNLIAVNVGYANALYDINVNRRPDYGVHPNLECDKSLVVAIFKNASNNVPVASIVNYAVHNTSISVNGGGFYNKCSTELTGIAMNKIESNYGGGFVSLFIQGFEGDVGPNCFGKNGALYNTVVAIGNSFGQDCTNILNGISVSNNSVSVNGVTSSQSLATKAGWGVSSQQVNFTAARIGDICFIGGSGEIFNQMGISLRLQSPFGAVVTAALVNGYSGYVPTLSGFNDGVGGPEVTTKSPWTSGIEHVYMTEMSKLVSSLVGGTNKLGYSSVGGNSESSIANVLTISKCNAGASLTIDTLKIYVQNATGKVRLGLYADNGFDSPTLIQQTGEITLVNGWNKGAISSTNIGPGTYWIGFVFGNSGNVVFYDFRKLGSYSVSYPFGSLSSKPVGMSWGTGMYSVYAGIGGTTIPVTGLNVNPLSASISVNTTLQITATVTPSNSAIKTVSWSSDNASVATVSSSGLVTGVSAGTAIITATTQDGGKTATCAVAVSNSILVTGVSLNSFEASISTDVTQQLTAVVSPSNATNKTVSWSSDNTSVATVNNTGLITGVAVGNAIITVTTQDGGKTATCAVTVSNDVSIIGLNSIGANNEKGDNGFWIADSFTAGSNMTVDRINLYSGLASGNARLGIYSSSSGEPGVLLAQTGEIPLSNGWNSGLLGSSQNLISGVTYWLVFEVTSSATTLYYNSAAGRVRYIAKAYGPLPSSAPTGLTSGGGAYSIYADNSGNTIPVPVTGVSVSPTSASISVNATQQLVAGVSPSNATNKTVSWSSDNSSVATVNSTGLVTGIAVGSAIISATTQDGGKTATCAVTVTSITISTTYGLNTIGSISEKGDNGYWITNSFTAVSNITINRMNLYVSNASGNARLGIYSNNSGEPGVLLAQTGEIPLTNGWNSGLLEAPQNLISGVTYWLAFEVSSSSTTLYYNSAAGRLRYKSFIYGPLPSPAPTGLTSGDGIYSLYADFSGIVESIAVTGVSISPPSASISVNATQQLTATISPSNATNKTVSWNSDNTSVATINSTGLVTAVGVGYASFTVTTQDGGKTAVSTITVSIGDGTTFGLNMVGSTTENGDNGFWIANSFTAVSNITVNRMNIFVGNASGYARLGIYSNNSGEPGALLAQTGELILSNGWNKGILDTPKNLISGVTYWLALEVTSSATTLYYNSAAGRLRYKAYAYGPLPSPAPTGLSSGGGIYSIYADNNGGINIPVTSISLSPTSASITENGTQQLIATVSPANATNKTVTWSSDNPLIASVNSNGLVTGIAAGSTTITVTTQDGGKTASSVITVNATIIPVSSVSVIPTSVSISLNATPQLTETVLPSNATNKTVSWSSDNPLIAAVNSTGLVTGIAVGSAIITVTTQDGGKTASSVITVGTLVTGVILSPTSASISVNATQQLTETVLPSNATNKTVSWSSDNPLIASVNSNGLVTGIAAGSATITVTTQDGGKTASSVITVNAAIIPVSSVSVIPTSVSISLNATPQLTETVLPSNATNKTVSWSSDNPLIAAVNSTGLVTGIAVGSATITVTTQDGGKTASSVITVGTLVTGVTLSPTSASISVNATQQLAATVLPSNATNKTVSWISGNTSVATVNSTGLVTGIAAGSATITVTTQEGGKIASSFFTISSGSGAYLGYNIKGAFVNGSGAEVMNASQFTAVSSFTANSMYVSLPYAVNGKIKGAIYSNKSGVPGSRLGVTSEITNPMGGSFEKLTGLSVPIKSGTKYWLVVWSNAAYSVDCETSGGLLKWKTRSYGSWPSTFPTPAGSSNVKLSIYVDGLKGAYLIDSDDYNVSADFSDSTAIKNTLNSNHSQAQLKVYPNPVTNGVLYINFASSDESAIININDLTGRMIYSKKFENNFGTKQLDISNLTAGIYLVNITQGIIHYNCKLIVE